MQELIYYPGFEVKDATWLKFALLYFDKLRPIIPVSGDPHISELYKQLVNETDLVVKFRPEHNYSEVIRASLDAMEVAESILRHPERYKFAFSDSNFVQKWKERSTQTYELWQEKYTYEWERFCLDHSLAYRAGKGIFLAKDLALIFMSILAQAISDARGISPVTDHPQLDLLSIVCRKPDRQLKDEIRVAQNVVDLRLPKHLEQIPLSTIIQFRNKPGFKQRLLGFHSELEKYYENAEGAFPEVNFVNSLGPNWQDYSDDILLLGAGVTTVALTAWIILSFPPIDTRSLVTDVALPAASLALTSAIAIRNTWSNTSTKRFCRRYLADLAALQ